MFVSQSLMGGSRFWAGPFFFTCFRLLVAGGSLKKQSCKFRYKCSARSTFCQLLLDSSPECQLFRTTSSARSTLWQLQLASCNFSAQVQQRMTPRQLQLESRNSPAQVQHAKNTLAVPDRKSQPFSARTVGERSTLQLKSRDGSAQA